MTTSIPTVEPEQVTAGDTVQWTRTLSDYPPSDGWTLEYAFSSNAGLFKAAGADNGAGGFLVTVAAADSALFVPGTYGWRGAVTLGAVRHSIGAGTTIVLPDLLATGAPMDTRTIERITLDNIEAVIAGTSTTDQASYSVEGFSISRIPIADLLSLRDRYKFLVGQQEYAERLNKGLGGPQNIMVRL